MREYCEHDLPKIARQLGASGGYYELLIAVIEKAAGDLNIDNMQIYTDTELMALLESGGEGE